MLCSAAKSSIICGVCRNSISNPWREQRQYLGRDVSTIDSFSVASESCLPTLTLVVSVSFPLSSGSRVEVASRIKTLRARANSCAKAWRAGHKDRWFAIDDGGVSRSCIRRGGARGGPGQGGDFRRGYQAKLEYCKICHGLSGEGYRGYYPMPRLAGQQPKYIENQLRAFSERRRVKSVMFNVAHVLSPATLAGLSEHFRNLNPEPIGGAPRDHLALGKTIYEQGLPDSNVPACSACHGPEARGHEEIPRLAGQLYPYTLKALSYWGKERGQGGSRDDTSASWCRPRTI